MRFKVPAVVVGALGVALVAAGCGSTGNVSSGSSSSANATTESSVGFGAANQQLCSAGSSAPNYTNTIGTVSGGAKSVSGAGSTFVAPMMSDWAKTYNQSSGVQISYQSIGSGGGIAQLQASTVDFGDSDVGMKPDEIAAAKGPVVQIPLLFGAVVPAYHVSGIGPGLKFTGDVLGKIFAGKITKWDDPALKSLNPGAKLPSEPIAVVHRSDASGTTAIFSDYLTKTSPTWVSTLGGADKSSSKTIAWPTGIGGKGNEGVSGAVNQTEGAIGYVELQYALAQGTTMGQVQNKAGKFIEPCIASASAAANGITYPPDLLTSFTDQSGSNAYPIAGSTYALVYEHQTSKAKAAALINYFAWVLTKGQDIVTDLHYAPLPPDLQKLAYAELKKITVNGQALAK
ncbi:MAG: phosphate ABC transporter substrate-binding protein PstS [Micromonosporaceae bacterium]